MLAVTAEPPFHCPGLITAIMPTQTPPFWGQPTSNDCSCGGTEVSKKGTREGLSQHQSSSGVVRAFVATASQPNLFPSSVVGPHPSEVSIPKTLRNKPPATNPNLVCFMGNTANGVYYLLCQSCGFAPKTKGEEWRGWRENHCHQITQRWEPGWLQLPHHPPAQLRELC